MAKLHGSTQILLITANSQTAQVIDSALQSEPGFNLIGTVKLSPSLLETIQSAQPDIILFEDRFEADESFQVIDQISSQYPSGAVVVILPESGGQLSERVVLAGARAFLTSPFASSSLINTLKRVRELLLRSAGISPEAAAAAPQRANKRTFVVYSPKGGVGCTTLAINLSIALQQQVHEKVLLVDGKRYLGHVALMLNLRTGNSISDLVPHALNLDESLIRQVCVEHVSGISVLPSTPHLAKSQGVRPDEIYKIILGLQNVYPNIVVDGGSNLDENLITYMDTADYILLVVTPNLASLRDARQFLDMSPTLSLPKEKILLILNQSGHKADVKLGDIEKALRAKVMATVPADEDAALGSLNDGVPVIQSRSNHPISKAVKGIARSLSTMTAAEPGAQKHAPDVLRKSSILG